jgi:hypothetical protein
MRHNVIQWELIEFLDTEEHAQTDIQWESIEFLDAEEHSQTAEGQSFHRNADLVVKVATLNGADELFLIHVEIENPWRWELPSSDV